MAICYVPSTTNKASNIKLRDTNNNYISKDVEGVLEEVNAQFDTIEQDFSSQIKENEKNFNERSVGNIKLNIPCYDGSNQAVHPKVLYFDNGWNGYKFWMAFTPYTKTNDKVENPSIAVSNDGIDWFLPTGITNPIVPIPSKNDTWYNSDCHIQVVNDVMECWYRKVTREPTRKEYIYRVKSNDGVVWTEPELLHEGVENYDNRLLCPVFLHDGSKYLIWTVKISNLEYFESDDGTNWTKVRDITRPTGDPSIWHMDIVKHNSKYKMIYCGGGSAENLYRKNLYYSESSDNINFTNAQLLLDYKYCKGFDCYELYRPSISIVENDFYIYYSACGKNDNGEFNDKKNWGTSLFLLQDFNANKLIMLKDFSNYSLIKNLNNSLNGNVDDLLKVINGAKLLIEAGGVELFERIATTSSNGTEVDKTYSMKKGIYTNGSYYEEYSNEDGECTAVNLYSPWMVRFENRTGDVRQKSKNKEISLSGTDNALIPTDGLNLGKSTQTFNEAYINTLIVGGFIVPCKYTTRPDMTGKKVASIIYDDTLKKPIYWDGGQWRDMLGNII